ncbi:Ig-like domain-containing protein [Phycicoccus sp. M110.8]|uniref:Ig-like domain-containing protein n=1 Tax=Phycicoccus sp. M110.8 TaxID=3075433 RepID=UPI0028FD4CE8|nr:Ig-like domain-containing protein [Phycicoccus sp. M110.8]MDU0314465.1 Ig-like domain-containing protein [Phycicoccus sp. M110.8]
MLRRLFAAGDSGHRRPIRPPRLRASLAAGALAASALVVAGSLPASASVSSGFELDGDVLDNGAALPSAPDWGPAASGNTSNSIFTNVSGLGVKRASLPTGFFDAGFARDFIPGSTADPTTFTTGAKDLDDIAAGWRCVGANNVTNKGDIQNGYTAVYSDTSFSPPHLILYFGMEKNTPNGDNNMGIWFLQDANVACQGGGGGNGNAFSGHHVDGDILLVAAFLNGGSNPQISAYKWVGGAGGALNTTAVVTGTSCGGSATICATTNSATVTTPWQTVNNKTQGTSLGADQFYEGGVDLTANGLDRDSAGNPICVNRFVFNTRSSQSLTASLYDYAEGNVTTCGTSSIATSLRQQLGDTQTPSTDTNLEPPNNTVTLPAKVYDTSTITSTLGTPAGTVTYSLWTDNTCKTASTDPTFTRGGNTATVTVAGDGSVPPSPSLVFSAADNYWWQAQFVPGAGSRLTGSTSACASEPLVVQKPSPDLSTQASASVVLGNSISDVARITGGYFPSGGIAPGTVTFKLYGPFAADATITSTSCVDAGTGANLITAAGSTTNATRVTDTTASATSASYTPTSPGKYAWVGSYSGNAQNNAASGACGDANESVIVTKAPASLTTAQSWRPQDSVTVTASVGGTPTGDVTFSLFANSTCTGTAAYSETVTLSGAGTAVTANAKFSVTAASAGTYYWLVSYAGDANHLGISGTCGDENSTLAIDNGGTVTSP